jgi:hypothetical protein
MEPSLQAVFEPFFLPLELRTLFMVLRLRSRGEEARIIEAGLRFSLLSTPVKRLLLEGAELPAILAGVGARMDFRPGAERDLPEILKRQGMEGCEEYVVDACLGHASAGRLHPAMAVFVTRLIDMENICALAKQLRWGMTGHDFVTGGSIPVAVIRRAALDREGGEAHRHGGRVLGREAGLSPAEAAPLLAARLGRTLRRQGREQDGVALILDYLWRRLVETRNLSLLLHGGDLDRVTLEEETVS